MKGVVNVTLTKNDYMILESLYDNNCITKMCSFTKQRMADECKLSVFKIASSMKMFINMGYIEEGAKEEKSKTYYVTLDGMKVVEKLKEEYEMYSERENR